jgi:hypothetical protein
MNKHHYTHSSVRSSRNLTTNQHRNLRHRLSKESQNAEFRINPPFPSLTSYKTYFVNYTTLESTLEYLIELAKETKIFTIDTKTDYSSTLPALIQIACVGDQSAVILVECWYLPAPHSYLFLQICRLFITIFDPTKELQAWGDLTTELTSFVRFNFFSTSDIQHIQSVDIQNLFRKWYNGIFPHSEDCCPSEVSNLHEDSIYLHPTAFDLNLSSLNERYDYLTCTCPHRPFKNPNETWTLQMAVDKAFNEHLDDTHALCPWGLGLDISLGKHIPEHLIGRERYMEIEQQKNYRDTLLQYAIHDCLLVTKLSVAIRHQWSNRDLEHYIQRGHLYNHQSDVANNEILSHIQVLPTNHDHLHAPNICTDSFTTNDYEPISDDDVADIIQTVTTVSVVPSLTATPPTINNEHVFSVRRKQQRSQAAVRRRCHNRNVAKRAHRHDFDIIRTVYRRFKIQQVEQVLNHLSIRHRHIHIRRNYQLHVGLHSYDDQVRYNHILNKQYFTQAHYDEEFGFISSPSHNYHTVTDELE